MSTFFSKFRLWPILLVLFVGLVSLLLSSFSFYLFSLLSSLLFLLFCLRCTAFPQSASSVKRKKNRGRPHHRESTAHQTRHSRPHHAHDYPSLFPSPTSLLDPRPCIGRRHEAAIKQSLMIRCANEGPRPEERESAREER